MSNEHRSYRRSGRRIAPTAVVVTAVAATTLTGTQAFAAAQRHDAQVSDDVVTLVTGDRVRAREDGGGRGRFELLPGSPSYGRNPMVFGSAEAMYVIPRMDVEARDRLDYSMFDVTALDDAQRGGPVPLEVRFEPGTPAHDVRGIDVEAASARRTATGSSFVADASYVAGETGVDPASWHGVANVRLANAPDRTATDEGRRKKRLKIRVNGRAGDPVKRADAWVQNLDDGRLFNKPVKVKNGRASVSVPKGNYSVMAFRGRYLAGEPELVLDRDRSVRLDLSDATVGYDVNVAGAHPVGKDVFGDMLVVRRSEKHGRFSIGADSTARLQPMPGPFSHGRLNTQVAGYFKRGDRKGPPNVFTLDFVSGIPSDLTFRHDRSDFARVPYRIHSDGAAREEGRYGPLIRHDVTGRGSGMPENTGWALGVDTPARYTLWFQADERVKWTEEVSVFTGSNSLAAYRIGGYEPGAAEPMHYLRGPIGPGVERDINGDRTGRHCVLCRDGNRLRGRLPMLGGARTRNDRMLVSPGMGSWQLRDNRDVLQHGKSSITPKLDLPAKSRRYTLRATSRMEKVGWRLSTRVSTAWGFSSREGSEVVPLLMPSYAPTTTLKGRAQRGPMTYRLDLENLGPVESRIAKASLRYSFNDGKSWQKARLHRLDKDSFTVRYSNPRAGEGRRYVSLRVRASDEDGRTVRETADRAYRLRRPE